MAPLVTLISADFAANVFASRFSSCIKKSRRRPIWPEPPKTRRASSTCVCKRSSSSSTSVFCANNTISCSSRAGSSSCFISANRSSRRRRKFCRTSDSVSLIRLIMVTAASRRCSIMSRMRSPSRWRVSKSSSRDWDKRSSAALARASTSTSDVFNTPGQRRTSTVRKGETSGVACRTFPTISTILSTNASSSSNSLFVRSFGWKRRLQSTLPRARRSLTNLRTFGSRLRSSSGNREFTSR